MELKSSGTEPGDLALRQLSERPKDQPKIDAAIKTAWLSALRSGEFKQARGTLYDGEGYCCLGVLCKITGLESILENDSFGIQKHFFSYGGDRNCDVLPDPLRIKLGILYSTQARLASMNDGNQEMPKSFSEIADYIEVSL